MTVYEFINESTMGDLFVFMIIAVFSGNFLCKFFSCAKNCLADYIKFKAIQMAKDETKERE